MFSNSLSQELLAIRLPRFCATARERFWRRRSRPRFRACSAAMPTSLGANRQPTPLQIEEQFAPRMRTLAHTVGEADNLLPALGWGSDRCLRDGLHVNAVDPEVDVAFGREVA